MLNGWVDWNADGDWAGVGEQVLTNVAVASGSNQLAIIVPVLGVGRPSFARFRLSTRGDLAPVGAAPDGEVEDYPVTLALPPNHTTLYIEVIGDGLFVITVRGLPNLSCGIQSAERLCSPPETAWEPFGTVQLNGLGVGTFTNAPAARYRFFRAVWPAEN